MHDAEQYTCINDAYTIFEGRWKVRYRGRVDIAPNIFMNCPIHDQQSVTGFIVHRIEKCSRKIALTRKT